MKNRGITLVEITIVVAVLAILLAILAPVYAKSKDAAKVTHCTLMLKQIGQAITIYRGEADNAAVSGDLFAMGLPTPPLSYSMPDVIKLSHGCAGHAVPRLHPTGFRYRYVPLPDNTPVGTEKWSEYVQKHGESAILVIDLNHNPSEEIVNNSITSKTALGVALDTSVKRLTRKGRPFDMTAFWHTQP